MGFGDEILAAGEAQVVYDADPSRRVAIGDARGQVRWHELWTGNPVIASPSDVARGEPVQRISNASGCRPYLQYPFTRQTGWRFTPGWYARDYRGRLYLSEAEHAEGIALQQRLGDYVVIEPSTKPEKPNHQWPPARYAAVVVQRPDLAWVQSVHTHTRTRLMGVSAVACHSFRKTCGILAHATAYVGPEGGMAHAAAALGVPAIVIFGGCSSVEVMGYPDNVNMADDSPETPCCRVEPCAHCERAMASITVDRVVAALQQVLRTREYVQ
jgi:hypothetical protein